MLYYKKYYFLIFWVLSELLYSQQNQKELDVNLLLKRSDSYIYVDFEKSLKLSKTALAKAEKLNNSQKRSESYLYVAKSLIFFRRFDECFPYLEKGIQEKASQKDIILKASFLSLQASYYSRMSLPKQAYRRINEVLHLLKYRNDVESQLIKSNMYMGLSDYYAELGNYETSHLYIDKSITISEKISQIHYFSSKRIHRMRAFIYFYKSSFFLEENKPVLAYPFIRKAYNQAVLEKYKYMVPFHEIYGDYYFKTQNYQKAIDFYLKCLEEKRKFKWQHASGLNTKISRAYKMLGDHEKQIYYLEKAEKRHSFDLKNDHKIVEGEMDRTLIKKQVTESKLVKNNILFVVFLFLLFTVLLVIIIAHHQSVKKKNSELMDAQKMILYKRESEIKEREETIGELQRKVNDSFSELINLAKNNSPYFFCRFQEVYPDFCTKMLEINPMLKSSELIFCAYIYLRFSTKEIAEYTFKAIKTIENNRYNLRKRLRLAPQEDLMIWIRKYIDAR